MVDANCPNCGWPNFRWIRVISTAMEPPVKSVRSSQI